MTGMRVVVIGAGLIGASVAYHLAREGAAVYLVDGDRPGGGTTGATFAYLAAFRVRPDWYARHRYAALRYWSELAREILAEDLVHRNGAIFIAGADSDAQSLLTCAEDARAIGLECNEVSAADLEELEPGLRLPTVPAAIVHLPEEGWLESVPMVERLLQAAKALTATVIIGTPVQGIERASDGVLVRIGDETIRADRVIIASGVGAAHLLRSVGFDIPMRSQPGVIAVSRPVTTKLERVVYVPGVHFRPDSTGRILLGQNDYSDDPIAPAQATRRAEAMLVAAAEWLPELGTAGLETCRIGVRPIPPDGLAIVGQVPTFPECHVAATHGGITLAGLVGKLCAQGVLRPGQNTLLDELKPQRFLKNTPRHEDFRLWSPEARDKQQPPRRLQV